ncbi:hypothetical protein EV673_2197 [Limnobacter thiooxidans]|uniref:Uncharacterized protein n=1 Tax=Limnobacter thiooxidans TaxID=131080 RepID=A0AA86J9F8_9BURK|nr:hypothetical protein EV673_2197 [Limnobacter thiooxidans]BET27135.1 hypothetical protein RGQ30_26360 [Limnobacter thiooxidans]
MTTTCFPQLISDDLPLHKGARTLDQCKCYSTDRYDNTEKLVAEVEVLTCDCLWRICQREAERIVAPGGLLIADPIARNRRINAAYAALWKTDNRFEWAGLAAFASKQVGCGLLHAAIGMEQINRTQDELEMLERNPWVPLGAKIGSAGARGGMESAEVSLKYVFDMLALGNTALFLDIYPLHMFYKKRGIEEMKKCMGKREKIYGHPKFPVLWTIQEKVRFGFRFAEIIPAFEAIEAGDIFKSVDLLARHEQKNILQPAIYEDFLMRSLLQGNQVASSFAYVTNFSTRLEQPVQLTLANQCAPLPDGRSIEFSKNGFANLANLDERMPFVLRAAKQFHNLLRSGNRQVIEQSIHEISSGQATR